MQRCWEKIFVFKAESVSDSSHEANNKDEIKVVNVETWKRLVTNSIIFLTAQFTDVLEGWLA
jgi:hypothetical protein